MKYITDQVKWGIIGAGDVCEKKSGPAFSKVPNSKLIAVMRRNIEKAKDYARRHKVSGYYNSASALINDPDINAVYIATPPVYHEEYALQAMQAGKPVYIEKPVTLNARSCQNLIDKSADYGIPVSVAHYRRRLPLFLKAKELIERNEIGEVQLVSIRMLQSAQNQLIADSNEFWRIKPEISGGGLFHDLAPHQLDILCWLFGKPESYSGKSFNQGKLYNAPDLTLLNAVFQEEIVFSGFWSFNVSENNQRDQCEIF